MAIIIEGTYEQLKAQSGGTVYVVPQRDGFSDNWEFYHVSDAGVVFHYQHEGHTAPARLAQDFPQRVEVENFNVS